MAGITHFLAMGGYATYIWPAFAVAIVIMAALAITSVTGYRRQQRQLARLEQEDAR